MKFQNRNVIITGGAGFIGSHLVDRLLSSDNKVTVLDDLSTGSLKNLQEHDNHPNLIFKKLDVLDEDKVFGALKGADFVFHLATRNVRLSLQKPTLVHEVNTTGTLNVLKAAAAARVKRFLYCSSSEVNGTADVVPMPEEYHYKPETLYGASKLTGEYYTEVFHRSGWLETVIARPHNNYGPREHYEGNRGEVIPRFILWALAGQDLVIFGDGKQTRDFTYVTETADYLVRLLETDEALGKVFNVCRGEEVSINEIAELVVSLTGSRSKISRINNRPSDVLRLFGDATKLNRLLGSSPTIPIQQGLQKTIAWFKEYVPVTPDVLNSMKPENWQQGEAESWLSGLGKTKR